MKPFVKWAGGKRQILTRIKQYLNQDDLRDGKSTYIEPFLGGGAVFFDLKPKKAIINDLNSDLINAYEVIKSDQYEKLIKTLKKSAEEYAQDADGYYYSQREKDRNKAEFDCLSDVDRAARMIFLNKTCYNGLYRVNSRGEFNTPMGRYKNPTICDEANIREIHDFLSSPDRDIKIMNASYELAIQQAKDGDVIYIDPPYDYEDDDGFTKYQMKGFTFDDFKKLKDECDEAINRGAEVIISNNATEKVQDLFAKDPRYKIVCYVPDLFCTLRSINCKGEERKTGKEIIIWGANNQIPQANDIRKVMELLYVGADVVNDKDKARARDVLKLNTNRQVAYYLAALHYLKYLTKEKTLNDEAKSLAGKREEISADVYARLKKDPIFSPFYEKYKVFGAADARQISDELKCKGMDLSPATIERRASTIKNWINWMYAYEKGNA